MHHNNNKTLLSYLENNVSARGEQLAYIFLADGETEKGTLTYRQLNEKALAIAAHLQQLAKVGDRLLLCYEPGLDFICGFLGCLYAGMIAVPAYPLRSNRHAQRLFAMVENCMPALILGTKESLALMQTEALFASATYVLTETIADEMVPLYQPLFIHPDSLAFLQYTSGSTGTPKGVMVSHGNVIANHQAIFEFTKVGPENKIISWLPAQHDMGLIGNLLYTIFCGTTEVYMPPNAFLEKPIRWLKAISRYQGYASGGPNFAYQLCVEHIRDEEMQACDLSSWKVAYNGAEPVRASTLAQFSKKFKTYGFNNGSFVPCYGMAETTLWISGKPWHTPYATHAFEESVLVSAGSVYQEYNIKIVNTQTQTVCESSEVGEIWLSGPSVAQGYWNNPEVTSAIFHAQLPEDDHYYLRTGDLGCLFGQELYITGRVKDLIILQGRNIYPQDVEDIIDSAHAAIRKTCTAVFSVDVNEQEQLIVVAEVERSQRKMDFKPVFTALRNALIAELELVAFSIQLVSPGRSFKTTSGKIQRSATKKAYLQGELSVIAHDDLWSPLGEGIPEQSIIAQQLNEMLCKILGEEVIAVHKTFSDLGGTSLHAVLFYEQLQAYVGSRIELSPSVAFDYPTLETLSAYLFSSLTDVPQSKTYSSTASSVFSAEPIAVIGMSCRFPKAEDPQAFWALLSTGRESIEMIPKSRWDWEAYYDEDEEAADKTYVKHGSFIEGIEYFDADFFGISPREAEMIDPQQRLLLETTWHALEDAGVYPRSLKNTDTSVFVGATSFDYEDLLVQQHLHNSYAATGNTASVLAGRISYALGLQGPCLTLDTACSSSLTALHEACNSLHLGETSMAIVGGVNALLSPDGFINLSKANMLARDGYCKVFSDDADGYVRGEGCGVVILKRLSDAQKDGNRILALIRSAVINQDGASSGLTVPNGVAQEKLLEQALAKAQLQPQDIDYLEAHGTGTKLGDPMETHAIAHVYKNSHSDDKPLIIGSVKANIGHLEAAAGMAGLIKVILSLKYEAIPSQIHIKKINPKINLKNIPGEIPQQLTPWLKNGRVRRAGISSFGFSGTNAHVILEEPPYQEEGQLGASLTKTVFNRERYWYPVKRTLLLDGTSVSLHPFLGARLDSPVLESVVYDAKLSLQNTPLLMDHVFYGVPIFAFAAYLSTIIEAIGQAQTTSVLVLKQLSVEKPLFFKEDAVTVLQTVCQTQSFEEDDIVISISSRDLESMGEWVEHLQGHLQCIAPASTDAIDIALLKQHAHRVMTGEQLFTQVMDSDVKLGPGFRWVEECYIGKDYVLAHLVQPQISYLGVATRHAGYLDAGFMLGATRCLQEEIGNQVFVPVIIEQLSIDRQHVAGGHWVYVRLLKKEEQQHSCQIKWLDAKGHCVDEILSMQFRYAPKERLLQTLDTKKPIEEQMQLMVWKEITLENTEKVLEKEALIYECQIMLNDGVLDPALLDLVDKLKSLHDKPTKLYVITHQAQVFNHYSVNLVQAAIPALLKTAQLENPLLQCIHIDCLEPCQAQVDRLMTLAAPESMYVVDTHTIYVGRLMDQKMVASLDEHWIVPAKQPMLITAGAYLISGGLGELGLMLAQWLMQQGASIWLLSRHPSEERIAQAQSVLGTAIHVLRVDMSCKDEVATAIAQIVKEEGHLTGVFHLAGELDDGVLTELSTERFQTVWSGKAQGAWYLHELTQDLGVEVFVLFSSVAALMGSAGQANYAMANAYLDGLAQYRRQLGLAGLSINWGPWQSGMAKDVQSRMQQAGIIAFSPADGCWALSEILKTGYTQTMALNVDWMRFAKARAQIPAWLSEMATGGIKPKGELVVLLEQSPSHQRLSILKQQLVQLLKRTLGMAEHKEVAMEEGFFTLGMDSLMAMEFRNQLQIALGSDYPLSAAEVFNYPDIEKLSGFIAQRIGLNGLAQPKVSRAVVQLENEPMAVIGMSCRFPGGANTPEEFWQLLVQGYDGIDEIPSDRWDREAYYDEDPQAPGKMRVKKGGFLRWPIADFDTGFFKISPRQAEMTDPQQRLLLELSVEALEDARIPPFSLRGTQTGVFVGVWHSDYADLLNRYAATEGVNQFTNSTTLSATAGAIAFQFGLMGPTYAVDTACSSSLVALDGAMKALSRGECEQAIVAGSNLMLIPDISIGFDKAGMLSPDGHCKTFDDSANGYVRSEGIGVIIVKRLSLAQKDNDHIYGIIKSSRVNHNGPASGITVPNGVAQAQLIENALMDAKVKPEDVDYIEAHGTGTPLGDPIEVSAIQSVFRGHRQGRPLLLGSVKSNIGHLEAAAGIAGLIKVLLALKHQAIPQNIHFTKANTKMDLTAIPAVVPTQLTPWLKQENKKRIAGVSSFGATGINAHVILEEAPVQDETQFRSIPTKTVFNRQRYWAEALLHKGKKAHPLLGMRLPETTNGVITYEQSINLNDEQMHYLQDHNVYSQVVYPGAAYIELFVSAARALHNGNIALKSVMIERPLILASSMTKMQLTIDADKLAIYSKSQEGWQLHSECIKGEAHDLYEVVESLAELKARINQPMDVSDFYSKAKAMGIEYGPHFQVIQRAQVQDKEALVYLSAMEFDQRYAVYPALLDGGLQALGLLAAQKSIYLPIGCERVIWSQVFTPQMVAHIHLLEETKELINANIDFYSGETCVMRLQGFTAKHASKIALFQERQWYYEIQWEIYELIPQDISKQATVYDARYQDDAAIELLSYLQKQLTEIETAAALYIITENAHGDPIHLNQSSLNGLIKTAILEYPRLNIRQLDVEKGQDISSLIEILNHDSGDAKVLKYKEGKWYSQKIAKQTGLHLPADEYRLIKDESGFIEKLVLIEEVVLAPGDDEVMIAPKAVGLNFRDVLNAMNLYPGDPGPLGGDVSGVITAAGKNVTEYHVGDEVLGWSMGSLASQTITKPELIISKPPYMRFAEAAGIPTIFTTAYLALIKLAKLQVNETVLIHAGAGGVGLAAIQIAQYLKANIICTASSDAKRKYLRKLGVKQVFDSRSIRFRDEIKDVDVVLNSLSGKGFIEASLHCCAKNARFVEIGKRDIWSKEQVKNLRPDIEYHILAIDEMNTEKPLQEVMRLFNDKILTPVFKTEFPLTKAIDAFKYLQQAKQIGKVVITLPPAHIQFKDDAYYLITGGSGGIGLAVAHYLREQGAKNIILSARHAPKEPMDFIFESCDISQEKQVKMLIKKYPIKGVFHAAGMIEDAPLDKQTKGSFEQVFAAKAKGAWYLHEATKKIDLDYFVLFSSIASMNGSPSQSNYAVANSFLDGLAQYRQQKGLKAISINWGPWKDVGMAKDLVATHERQGLKPLSNQDALEALTYALKQPNAQLGVINANWQRLSESLAQPLSWLALLIEEKQDTSFIQSLQSVAIEQREALLKQTVVQEIKKVLGHPQTLDETKSFFEMGMDSLMMLELSNRLQRLFAGTLAINQAALFEVPTIMGMVTHILDQLRLMSTSSSTHSAHIIGSAKRNADRIVMKNGLKIIPVSFLQHYWLTRQIFSDIRAGMVVSALEIAGTMDVDIFRLAVDKLVERNEIFRTTFLYQVDELKQVIHHELAYAMKTDVLKNENKEEVDALIHKNIQEISSVKCDFTKGPLLYLTLININEESTFLAIAVHHLCSDAISMFLIVQELNEIYMNLCADMRYQPPVKPIQYADFSLWQHEQYAKDALAEYQKFWQTYLRGAQPLTLPYSSDIDESNQGAGQYIEKILGVDEKAIADFAKNNETTPFVIYFMSFLMMSAHVSKQDDMLLSVPQSGRNVPELKELIGFVASTCLMRFKISTSMQVKEAIESLTKNNQTVSKYYMPFDRVRTFDTTLDMGLKYNILFEYIATKKTADSLFGLELKNIFYPAMIFDHDIIWQVETDKDHVSALISYSKQRYVEKDIKAFAQMWSALLEGIISHSESLSIEDLIKATLK